MGMIVECRYYYYYGVFVGSECEGLLVWIWGGFFGECGLGLDWGIYVCGGWRFVRRGILGVRGIVGGGGSLGGILWKVLG